MLEKTDITSPLEHRRDEMNGLRMLAARLVDHQLHNRGLIRLPQCAGAFSFIVSGIALPH